jgi:hypothetical protein
MERVFIPSTATLLRSPTDLVKHLRILYVREVTAEPPRAVKVGWAPLAETRALGAVPIPERMKRIWPAVVITLLGCAHLRTASQPPAAAARARGIANATNCIVADTSAITRDTLYAIGAETHGDDAATADCEHYATATAPVIITETPAPGTDLRDVLDRGLPAAHLPRPDVVVTRDPNVLAYAANSADYFTVVLPYDRTYFLVAVDSASPAPSQAERDALARDAVSADARGAVQPFASMIDTTCLLPFAPSPQPARPVVAYPASDPIARQLAERIVALAGAQPRPAWLPASLASGSAAPHVAAIDAGSAADALLGGRAAAAIVAVPRNPHTECGTSDAPTPWRGVPLVDSRAHAIVRRGSGAAFIIGGYGTLRFTRRGTP